MTQHSGEVAASPQSSHAVEVPVEEAGRYHVIVVGGGLSGVCAAVASARTGARTLLVEALPFVGGNGTTGLPISGLRARNSEVLVVRGLVAEILDLMRHRGAVSGNFARQDWIAVDAEQLQLVLGHLLESAGVSLLTYSPLLAAVRAGVRISDAVFYNKDGRALRYRAEMFVDTTGDAQVARLAGLTTPMGRQRDGRTQTMSLVFSVAGIDERRTPPDDAVVDLWHRWQESGTIRRNQRRNPSINNVINRPGWRSFIATRIHVPKGTDNRLLALAELEGRKQIEEFVESFLRPHVPGYEHCFLAQIANHMGVRETRRISGLYEMSVTDLLTGRKFPDSIACNASSVENHQPDSGSAEWQHLHDGDYYTIPYRSLVAREVDNLLASGRCISASHEALAALRVLSPSMATGQAAGTAAALAALERTSAHELDPELLRAALRSSGAIVD
ncbi:FAD-dependent oxidoreductase [Streptomyces litchfieldiae]|uniref:FAD-dependent oxidoreductase n=1 Tax=Streptomyces litchfieldiae TaxID=3075543 RepID=A0ABU2N0A2_9ACTN|nr:FAD-dependent oxidoreductase [Streptomyces sp. DSM 44938]MDT0346194.1 FAD-dependent oxidoreductase [Streptomyces sp. DSM 44938]